MPPEHTGIGRAAIVESATERTMRGAVARLLLVCGIMRPLLPLPVLGRLQATVAGTSRMMPVAPDITVRQASIALTASCQPTQDVAKGSTIGTGSVTHAPGMLPLVGVLAPRVISSVGALRL